MTEFKGDRDTVTGTICVLIHSFHRDKHLLVGEPPDSETVKQRRRYATVYDAYGGKRSKRGQRVPWHRHQM